MRVVAPTPFATIDQPEPMPFPIDARAPPPREFFLAAGRRPPAPPREAAGLRCAGARRVEADLRAAV
ncbi:hypothetical protein A5N74_17235 [Prescottella equi]|nr:hypothetical protein A5N74_17235 [Prescottella equi]